MDGCEGRQVGGSQHLLNKKMVSIMMKMRPPAGAAREQQRLQADGHMEVGIHSCSHTAPGCSSAMSHKPLSMLSVPPRGREHCPVLPDRRLGQVFMCPRAAGIRCRIWEPHKVHLGRLEPTWPGGPSRGLCCPRVTLGNQREGRTATCTALERKPLFPPEKQLGLQSQEHTGTSLGQEGHSFPGLPAFSTGPGNRA